MARATIPIEVINKLQEFNKALGELEGTMAKHFAVTFEQHLNERNALELARIDVMSVFSLSSLGWIIAAMKGEDPDENGKIRTELLRSKDYYERLNELLSRKTAPRVNAIAAKNFIRNALWEIPVATDDDVTEDANTKAKSSKRSATDSIDNDNSVKVPKKSKKR